MLKAKHTVGLDIGSSTIKLVQLKQVKDETHLHAFDIAPLPPETIVDGTLMNYGVLVETVRRLVRKSRLPTRKCAIGLSGNSVIIKKLTLPRMTAEELDQSMVWEAEQYIPFEIQDVNVDVQILDDTVGQDQMEVILVAAKKDVVANYMDVCNEAGLKPVVADVDAFALQNAFELNYGFPANETIALLNLGASVVQINVISDGMTVFTRDILMGGRMLTNEIQKALNVSFEEAEEFKLEANAISDDAIGREVRRLSEKVSMALVTEVQRSLDFFAATSMSASLSRVFASGGAVHNPAVVATLERFLEVPVEVVNPFRRILVDPRRFDVERLGRFAPQAAVAVGLGLRRAGDQAK